MLTAQAPYVRACSELGRRSESVPAEENSKTDPQIRGNAFLSERDGSRRLPLPLVQRFPK
jgi:hypothetical protein